MVETFDRPTSQEQRWGYAMLRAFLGVCFWGHGLVILCFGKGLTAIAGHMLFSMAETHLPQNLILLFAYSQPAIDFVLGAMFIMGIATVEAIFGSFLYLCVLTINFALDTDWPSAAVTIGATAAVAVLLVGRKRFDTHWHLLMKPKADA